MSSIAENYGLVREKVAESAIQAGRKPEEIKIIAVTKTVPAESINEGIDAGITDIGENRVQEAVEKFEKITKPVKWHLVGHLQTNKVKKALEIFGMIHSIDRLPLVEEINERAKQSERTVECLVQVNTSREVTKSGVMPEKCLDFIDLLSEYKGISVKGLMTIGILSDNPEQTRNCFRILKNLYNEISAKRNYANVKMEFLSMGMSSDYELAIAEGSNMVRIGTAIFGKRQT